MFKRIALALTFVAAFSVAGLSFSNSADAWRYLGRPYAARYVGPPRAYGYRAPYRAYYAAPYIAPRVYRPYYSSYYAGPSPYYYAPRGGVSVSFGY